MNDGSGKTRSDVAKYSWLCVAVSVTEAKDGEQLEYYDLPFMLHFINKCFV